MVAPFKSRIKSPIVYPESDGRPMADNTRQFRWITTIHGNLEWQYADDPKVFIAGDLLWYPVEGQPKIRQAPDVMVVFGRPKGDRGSYLQWREDNIAPQVVFEIRSPGNRQTEMDKKLLFYDRYGVEEYYLYDPDRNDLSGWLRDEAQGDNSHLNVIETLDNWVSPRLQIRFELTDNDLKLYRANGEAFLTYNQLQQQAETERQRAENERQRAENERQRAENERQR
ncbi:Uma2 family endonuclease, partial [Baaleninema sp.]|uniref:Uma2 family endonuclease n=1 Tax=Baaleninema sp. TaxID=3101197 RepID=UPI003D083B45